jgi:dTDP-4-dehydrorhamnose reductase|tara:strand:+ start:217 stop:909 length:693 start_codon:yes stop_codon:yes gene_type:complete
MKILVTGSNGRFAKVLKDIKSKYNFIYTTKKNLDITSLKSIKSSLKKNKPKYVIHLAGLSRPMSVHNKRIKNSIDLNIIGTCNLVKICSDLRIKIIYFSTSYVYPGTKGNYKEIDGVLPWSNYAWSKLGGECAVQMYKNSLILRVCMTEKPFIHKYAFSNVKTNFIYHEDFVKLFLKLINKKGIFNIGGKTRTVFNFVKRENKNIKKKLSRGEFPLNQDMNLTKLNKLIK